MNEHDYPRGDSRDDLGLLIADAVADVEPAERLDEIRRTTSRARRTRRTWYAGGATLLAAAAAVTAFVVVSPGDDPASDEAPIAEDPSGPVQVYYVGPGPDGPDAADEVLYRYTETGTDPLSLLMATPSDPDYRTLWPEGSLLSYELESGVIRVRVDGGPLTDELAVQQLVYTLQGVEETDAPLEIEDAQEERLIEPIGPAPQLDVLSHMSIDTPAEGQTVTGSLTVTGRSNGFEASVACFLYVGNDGGAYAPFVGTAEGWMEERLFPWELVIDLTREPVPPGEYSLTCSTDDPTGGAEGSGAGVDTRTITVE